jgi:hypothetical protein
MHTEGPVRIVFAEEDTLFRLMEAAVTRQLTPGCEKALTYFFGQDFSSPLSTLTSMADRLGLPSGMEAVVCCDNGSLDEAVSSADFLVVEREPIRRALIQRDGHASQASAGILPRTGVPEREAITFPSAVGK